jgi:hypothetical protein
LVESGLNYILVFRRRGGGVGLEVAVTPRHRKTRMGLLACICYQQVIPNGITHLLYQLHRLPAFPHFYGPDLDCTSPSALFLGDCHPAADSSSMPQPREPVDSDFGVRVSSFFRPSDSVISSRFQNIGRDNPRSILTCLEFVGMICDTYDIQSRVSSRSKRCGPVVLCAAQGWLLGSGLVVHAPSNYQGPT